MFVVDWGEGTFECDGAAMVYLLHSRRSRNTIMSLHAVVISLLAHTMLHCIHAVKDTKTIEILTASKKFNVQAGSK